MRYPSALAVLKELRALGLAPPLSALRAIEAMIAAARRDALDAFAASLFAQCVHASWAGGHGGSIGAYCMSLAYRSNEVDVPPDVAATAPMATAVRRGKKWWALISDFGRLSRR